MRLTLFILFIMTSHLNVLAQNDCNSEEYHQFDFWIGDWAVTDTTGKALGENSIQPREKHCILLEQWNGVSGSTGSSFNYFDRTDSTWNQLWIDNQGNKLILKGNREDDKMILSSDFVERADGSSNYNRITWQKNADGTVYQIWDILNKDDAVIQTVFYGVYRRKE